VRPEDTRQASLSPGTSKGGRANESRAGEIMENTALLKQLEAIKAELSKEIRLLIAERFHERAIENLAIHAQSGYREAIRAIFGEVIITKLDMLYHSDVSIGAFLRGRDLMLKK
jgi:hypothetical protein